MSRSSGIRTSCRILTCSPRISSRSRTCRTTRRRVHQPVQAQGEGKDSLDDFERDALDKFLQSSEPTGMPAASRRVAKDSGLPEWYRAIHDRQEGVSVHPGRLLQVELPDELPRQG